ncbi:hypothetical protein, conserved [Angomonas deanei]|uniref:Uncharacterized protein n=1 Tax=Angomonas deanei TaxID=59799 RepID=A0A7G2C280_9TRYP|nr:hypothetical protein, conserved [Angomonas deanei]
MDTVYTTFTVQEWEEEGSKAGTVYPHRQPTVPHPLHATLCCGKESLLVIGGWDRKEAAPLAQVLEWDRASFQWRRLPDLPVPLSEAQSAVTAGGCVLVFGGSTQHGLSDKLWLLQRKKYNESDVLEWTFLPAYGTYQECPQATPTPRIGHSLTTGKAVHPVTGETEEVLYLFGGFDGQRHRREVWRLWVTATLATQEAVWEEVVPAQGMAPSPRRGMAVVFDPSQYALYVFGGVDCSCNEVYTFYMKENQNRWVCAPTQGVLPAPQRGVAACLKENSLLLFLEGTCGLHLIKLQLADMRVGVVKIPSSHLSFLSCRANSSATACSESGETFFFGGTTPDSVLDSLLRVGFDKTETANSKKK